VRTLGAGNFDEHAEPPRIHGPPIIPLSRQFVERRLRDDRHVEAIGLVR
jgi:hypothetical protein